MKKRIIAITLALMCLLVLAGCSCDHEWNAADCTTPKTCEECDETKGEPLGHDWKDASCSAPKTCRECGETKGEALEHTWAPATCEDPQSCTVCGATNGEARGHSWLDATYDAPKTCENCGVTEGEPLEKTSSDFTSSSAYANICRIIDQNMGDMDPEYEFDAESGILYISLMAPEGTAAAMATNPTAIASAWETLKTSFSDLSSSAQVLISSSGYPDIACCIMLRNDANPDNVLLGILNGQVIFDAMSE